MRFTLLRHAPLWASLPFNPAAHAAASLLVDDAGTTSAGQCQLESWIRHHGDHQARTAVPACTIGGTEWSLGGSHLRGAAPWTLGAKRTLHGLDDARMQIAISGAVGGDMRHAGARGWTLNLPVSVALDAAGKALLHTNLGWDHARADRGLTAGVGGMVRFAHGASLLAEHWRDADRNRSEQIGIRLHLRNVVSLDLLAGRTGGGSPTSWVTVGLNLSMAP